MRPNFVTVRVILSDLRQLHWNSEKLSQLESMSAQETKAGER
jgi:hypothetical protein